MEKADLMKVMDRLLDVYSPKTAVKWLRGQNAFLNHQTPLDFLEEGKWQEVLDAINQGASGSYI